MQYIIIQHEAVNAKVTVVDTEAEALEIVRNILDHGGTSLEEIQVFCGAEKKIVVGFE